MDLYRIMKMHSEDGFSAEAEEFVGKMFTMAESVPTHSGILSAGGYSSVTARVFDAPGHQGQWERFVFLAIKYRKLSKSARATFLAVNGPKT